MLVPDCACGCVTPPGISQCGGGSGPKRQGVSEDVERVNEDCSFEVLGCEKREKDTQ